VFKECTEACKSRDIEGNNRDEARSKLAVAPVEKYLDPKIEVLLEEVQFMPSPRLS
jgi:hypothetical protein